MLYWLPLVGWFFLPELVLASVTINEISPSTDPEWVELYNNSDQVVDISDWSLKDTSQKPQKLSGSIPAQGYFVFTHAAGWLNNSGSETLTLSDAASAAAQIDTVSFGNSDLRQPDSGHCLARIPDGGIWTSVASCTKNTPNYVPPSVTPIPPTPTHTLVPTSTPKSPTYTPIWVPTRTSTPSHKKLPTITLTISPSITNILGVETTKVEIDPTQIPAPTSTSTPSASLSSVKTISIFPVIAIGAGIFIILGSVLLAYYRSRRYTA